MEKETHMAGEEITIENLEYLFKNAYFQTEIDENDELKIYAESFPVRLTLKYPKYIHLLCVYLFKEEVAIESVHRMLNIINKTLFIGRAYAYTEDNPMMLFIDWVINRDEGVIVYDIIESVRRISSSYHKVKELDEDNIIDW